MKLLKYRFTLLIFLFYLSCVEKPADEKYVQLNRDLRDFYSINTGSKTKQFIFINDKGCPTCIVSFSGFILQNMEKYNENSMVFINSRGQNVDLDKFSALNLKNVHISRNIREKGNIIPDLGIVYLKENKQEIDTIISISPEKFIEQINYIKERAQAGKLNVQGDTTSLKYAPDTICCEEN